MATILSYITIAIASALGIWLALVLVTFVVLRVAGPAEPVVLASCRIGGFAMLLPSFWLAIFLGSPLGGGLFIRLLGESAATFGLGFGFAASFFVGVVFGAACGAVLSAAIQWVRQARNVA
jgi:hypothetical protein